ncbi:MAG: DUF1002 domain-containing protein [Sarcina sp.]
MSVKRNLAAFALCGVLLIGGVAPAFADGANVVTLGANLTEAQKQTVLKYFDVKENEAVILEVNNQEERKYLEGVASEAQIGTRTFSCAYVEPTTKGKGIKVKTVNLTYVTSAMIASTLATCGITDANVIAMSPMPVSGTGALTGVMKAFEDATGEKLDEEKKEIATEELVITGDLADTIGPDKATGVVNDIKTEIIKENTKDTIQIAETIVNVTNNYNVTLTAGQKTNLENLMKKIAEKDYDYSEMKDTLQTIGTDIKNKLDDLGESIDTGFWDKIVNTVSGWFDSIGNWFSGIFNDAKEDLGILGQTKDELLGEDVIVDATDETAITTNGNAEEVKEKGFFEKIIDWFKGLFNSDKTDTNTNPPDSNKENATTGNEQEEETIIGGGEAPNQENEDKATDETESDNTNTENNNTDENEGDNTENLAKPDDNKENEDTVEN